MNRPPAHRYDNAAEFRFYDELNDFLRPEQREQTLAYRFNGHPGIKDPIEVLGIPHPEVGLIVANGHSVGFDYRLQDGDRVAVYSVFESCDTSPIVRLRAEPLRNTAFIVDVNLGKLARHLRLFGLDTLFANTYEDREIAEISVAEHRIVLTRDRRLLYAKSVAHGYWVRSADPLQQLAEVVRRFELADRIAPFTRCTACNGLLEPVEKQAVVDLLEPKTRRYYENFFRCENCGKIYWEGSHTGHMRTRFAEYFGDGKAS